MAPSEETTSATCSQQQEQEAAGAKLQQDSPKIQQGATTNHEESIDRNTSSNCMENVDPVVDSPKSVATNGVESINSPVESQNSDVNIRVGSDDPQVHNPDSVSNNCIGNVDSVVDSPKNVDTTCQKDIDQILGSPQNVENADQVVRSLESSATITGVVGQGKDSPKSVANTSLGNTDQILDGPKKVATNCVGNIDRVVNSSRTVSADNMNQGMEHPKCIDSVVIGKGDKVADDPKNIPFSSVENAPEVTCRLNCKNVSAVATTCVENVDCAASGPKQQVANMSTGDASHVTHAAKDDYTETAKEGCCDKLSEADDGQSCDGVDDVREKCMSLLKELVSQADEVTRQRRDGTQQMEGGPLWCRLPFSKVSEALQSCKSSTNSALDDKQSNTKQYTTCNSQRPTANESNFIRVPMNDCRVKEMGASSSVLTLYPSPPDSFAEESTPPPVFQGHKTMTVDSSLPSTPDESSDDSPSGEAAITPFTPSSTKLPGSPSIASVTPSSSDTVLGTLCMPHIPKTPDSGSFLEGNVHELAMVEQKTSHPSTTTMLATPRRFLFQVEPVHQMELSDGQKLFACDICSGVYQRSFSLKRHYLRAHINHRYLTERDISNCGIIVSERLAKENPSFSSVEKKNVAVGVDIDALQGSPDNAADITKSSSGDEYSTVNPMGESFVFFPNLYRCHLCSNCFDTKDELSYHLSTHKSDAAVCKEKTTPKPINGNRQARSKSLPDLKKGSKEKDRSPSASSHELSSISRIPTSPGQLPCDSMGVPLGHISRPVTLSDLSSFAVLDQSVPTPSQPSKSVTPSSPKSAMPSHSKSTMPCHSSKSATSSHSLKNAPSNHSSKHATSEHSSNPVTSNHSSKPSVPNPSSKSVTSEHCSKSGTLYSFKPNTSSKLLSSEHSSKHFLPDHSLKSSSSVHSSKLSSPGQSSKPSSPGHPSNLLLPSHSSKSESIPLPIAKLAIPDQLLRPVMSVQYPATLGQFTKPTSDKLLKSTSSSERGQLLCLYCDKSFSTPTLRKRHVSRSHPQQPDAQLSSQNKTPHHKCAYCTKPSDTFRELPLLVQHLQATHPDLYHVCTTCELRFDSKDALDYHLNISHNNESRLNAVVAARPLPTLSQTTATSDVNVMGKLSQSAPKLRDESKMKSSTESVNLLGGSGEFQYSCSVCHQMFNDYVAMCRHHRQVHKGKRTLNSFVGGMRSPTPGLDSRSQSPFVVPEKGSQDQVHKNDTEDQSDDPGMKLDVLCKKPVDSNGCIESESEVIKLPSQRHDPEAKDPALERIKESHETINLNKNFEVIEPKDQIDNVAKGKSKKDVAFTVSPSVVVGEESDCSPRSPHLTAHLTLFGNNAEQTDVISNSVNKCASIKTSDSLDTGDSAACVRNEVSPLRNNCDLSADSVQCSDDSSGENGDFVMKSDLDSQVFETVDSESTSDNVLCKQKEKSVIKTSKEISGHSENSPDFIVAETSVCVDSSYKGEVLDTVEELAASKPVDSKLAENADSSSKCSMTGGTPGSVMSHFKLPVAGMFSLFKVCSGSSLAETSASVGPNLESSLDISEPVETKSGHSLPGILDSLIADSDIMRSETTASVNEKSKNFADVISESMKNKPLITETKDSTKENSKSALEDCYETILAERTDSTWTSFESSCNGTSDYEAENSKLSRDEATDYEEQSSKLPSDETSISMEDSCEPLLAKMPDSLEDNVKPSLGELSDYVKPVLDDTSNSVGSSSGIISDSMEPSLDESSCLKASVAGTLETLVEASTLSLTDNSNFTEEISKPLLNDNLDTTESGKLSLNAAEEYYKFTSPDTLHSSEESLKLSLAETADTMYGINNPSLVEISGAMELQVAETRDSEENSKFSFDNVANGMNTSNSAEESTCSVEVISNKPLLETENMNSLEGLEIDLTKTSDSVEENSQSSLIESSEGNFEPLLTNLSMQQNCKPVSTGSSDSVEENSKSGSTESFDSVGEYSKTVSTEIEENSESVSTGILVTAEENSRSAALSILDFMDENSNSALTESSNIVGENSKPTTESSTDADSARFDSVKECHKPASIENSEDSNSLSTESLDSVKENHKPVSAECSDFTEEITESSDPREEDSNSVLKGSLDSAKENKKPALVECSYLMEENTEPSSTKSLDSLEENCKPALTEGSDSIKKCSNSILTESLEPVLENPKHLFPEIVDSTEIGFKPLLPEASDSIKSKSKSQSAGIQEGDELVSIRVLRSKSASLTKSSDHTEASDTLPLCERLVRSKNEATAGDQAAGRGRVLRSSSAISVPKPAESVADLSDHARGDGNRVLRSSFSPKSDEPLGGSVDQDVTADVDSGTSKSRSKVTTAATRGTRLRKFSRRVRGEPVQEEQRLDPETLFYCRIAGNIRENLLHHLDGKLELEEASREGDKAGPSQPTTSVSTNQEEKQHQLHHHHHHSHPRAHWEKFNFPKNYDGRCGEGAVCLASYIKDMSHLDIPTQLTMRQNLRRLSAAPTTSRSMVDVSDEISKDDVVGFSRGLCLNAKVSAEKPRRRSLRSAANRGRDALAAAPGGAASTFTASASLKRWSSADDVAAAGTAVELSGEWVRPRSYICAACGVLFSDLWDLEDHKYSQHPNVWCTHYEFEQAALEQSTDTSKTHGGIMSSKDLCRRFLLVRDAMETVPLPTLSSEVKCTKCERGFSTLPELHRHILECGGDTTWMLLPSPNSNGRRTRKWRPFGSRRRRQQGSHRRGMKRNIPTTPVKQYFRTRHRTVGGDSIQRMLANLPAKRSTRRVIQFSEDEIKTRSQGTIHSVSFASGMLRTSHKTGHKLVQSLPVRAATSDPSDTTSKKLTIRTPKKLPASPSVTPTSTSEQTSAPKQRQLTIKKLPRAKSQPASSVPQSKCTGSEGQKRAKRGGRSLSPAVRKSEPVPLDGSVGSTEDTKQPSLHKSRGRSKKKSSLPANGDGLAEPTEEIGKKNAGPDISVEEFDVDITSVSNSETSNILAAMRIAMLEGVITETSPAGTSTKKVVKKLSVKKQPGVEENKTALAGKRKKVASYQENPVKKKTKLSQSELEERFLRNKGYTHPDEITDEPIICKGCGLQFDSGSAELRHRKTCIYVLPGEDMGLNEEEQLHTCLQCCVQFPSASTLQKHTEQCKVAEKSNTENTGMPSTSPKKTASGKARSKKGDPSGMTITGKELDKTEDVVASPAEPKKSRSSENTAKIGRPKAKLGVTKTKKERIKSRSGNDVQIVKRKKPDLVDNVDNNDGTAKKQLTNAENISSSTMKMKVENLGNVSTSPIGTHNKLDGTESTTSIETKKEIDKTGSSSSSAGGTKKKLKDSSSPGRPKKKFNDIEIGSGDAVGTGSASNSPLRTKKKPEGAHSSPGRTKKKLDNAENINSSPLGTKEELGTQEGDNNSIFGIVESSSSTSIGTKKKCSNTEKLGSISVGTRRKPGDHIRRSVSSSPVGGRKKPGNSPIGTKKKFESTENQLDITKTDGSSPVFGKEQLNMSATERTEKQHETEVVSKNPARIKKRSSSAGSVSGSPIRTKSKLDNARKADIAGTKKKFCNSNSGSSGNVISSPNERRCPSTENPANSDIDDKMPELQKEEPLENLKTETPSPKVGEDLCDIPILSPVCCEPLREDCEEKRSDECQRKDSVDIAPKQKEEQPLSVQGKKRPKTTVKKSTGLKQVRTTIKIKPSGIVKKKDVQFEIFQIPVQNQSGEQETSMDSSLAVVGSDSVILQGEMDSDDKPLAECLGALIVKSNKEMLTCRATTANGNVVMAGEDKDATQDLVQHRNGSPVWDRNYNKEVNKSSPELIEEDSNDDMLPISKLKEVIQKKTLPLEEMDSNTSEAYGSDYLVEQSISRVAEGLVEKSSAVRKADERSESFIHYSTVTAKEPSEISSLDSLVEKIPVASRRGGVKQGKRGRTRSWHQDTRGVSAQRKTQALRKASLPGDHLEISADKEVPIDIQPEVEKIVIPKSKARKSIEKVESQESTGSCVSEMEDPKPLSNHGEENKHSINKGKEMQDKKTVVTNRKRKTRKQLNEVQSQDGDSLDFSVSQIQDTTFRHQEETNHLVSKRQGTNVSEVGEKKVAPLLLCKQQECETASSAVGEKLLVAKRKAKRPPKEIGSQSATCSVGQMHDNVPHIEKGKQIINLVNDECKTKMSDVGEQHDEPQSERRRRDPVIGKRRTKRQVGDIGSQYKDNGDSHIDQTQDTRQEGETNHLINEREAADIGKQQERVKTSSVISKRIVGAKRKSKRQLEESRPQERDIADSAVDQTPDSRPSVEEEEKTNYLVNEGQNTITADVGEQKDVCCEEQETERTSSVIIGQAKVPVEETVLSCKEIEISHPVSSRKEKRHYASRKRKESHLIYNEKEVNLKERKKSKFLVNKTKGTGQQIKLVIDKRRKRSFTVDREERAYKLIGEEEEKLTVNTEETEASILQDKDIGNKMETDKISGKEDLIVSIVEEEDTSTSVVDTDNKINLIFEAEDMNVLTCDMEEATNTLVETDDSTNHLTDDLSMSVFWKQEISNLTGGSENKGRMLSGQVSSNLICDKEGRRPAVQNEEMKNVNNKKEDTVTLTGNKEEISDEILGLDVVHGKTSPAKKGDANSLDSQDNGSISVVIQQCESNDQVVQMGSLSSAINTVTSKEVRESEPNVEGPLRQARRTRCNTSYEELYTWSDVTSETEEDSSQDLPDANILATLCQGADSSAYEQIAAMIANGGHFFPSSSKKKKKKKLRNNSRQYRNGQLRRKRRKKQKLRTKLLKKSKRSAASDFIVTDIETGQEESQDSCESVVLAEILRSDQQLGHGDANMKPMKRKRKKSVVKPESEKQAADIENVQISDGDRPKQKRKSSVGSMFYCTSCNKHYSTNYNLMKHKLSLMHKRLSEADVQNTECELLQTTKSKESCPSANQIVEAELPTSVNKQMEISVDTKQPCSLVHASEMDRNFSSVKNTETEKSCHPLIQFVCTEQPCSSSAGNQDAGHSSSVAENAESADQCSSLVQNIESKQSCSVEPEQMYSLIKNMDIEQFSSTVMGRTSFPEIQSDVSDTCAKKATTLQTNKDISEPGNSIQNSSLDSVLHKADPMQTGTGNGMVAMLSSSAAGGLSEQATVWPPENQANVAPDWLRKESNLQQNMNAANWPTASGEQQKQTGWFEGQVDNNQWLYTGQWSQEMAWGREVNPDVNWNADSSQDDGTFFQSNSASLGSILDSVNQILDNGRSADGLSATDGYPPYVDLLQPGTSGVDPAGGLRELQQAMGATDEEMAMLQQLGESTWPLEDADIMDLDNQKSAASISTAPIVAPTSTATNTTTSTTTATVATATVAKVAECTRGEQTRREEDGIASSSSAMAQAVVTTRTFSGRGGLRSQDMQLARYESKDMVCPVCSRRFLGLTALRAHLAAAHNSSTRHRTQAVFKRPRLIPSATSDGNGEPTRYVCVVCKELLPDEQGLADHVGVAHVDRQNPTGKLSEQRPDGLGSSNHGGGGDEGLRSHMTSALGGLLTRALNNFLGKNRSQPSPPDTEAPSPAGSPGGSRNSPLLLHPVARLLGRGLKMTNRRHSSGTADEQLFNCVDCDERFTSESNRNRHVARAHRGQQHRRLSTDSPLESTRIASPFTSNYNTVSETDTDTLPLSISISNSSFGTRTIHSEPCKSQLTATSTVGGKTLIKEGRTVMDANSSQKDDGCGANTVQDTANRVGTPSHSASGNSGEVGGHERTTVAAKSSASLVKRQEGKLLFEGSRTDWRNGMKAETSQPRLDSLCGVSDEDSIKAKAVAALRALNARDRRIRSGLPGTVGAAMWSGVSRKKSRGLNSDDRFRFPLVRKTPPSTNRFASLAEKKKKNVSGVVKFEALSQSKESPDEGKQVPKITLKTAIPISYDIYEFQDEVEQVQSRSEFGLAEFRSRAPLGKAVPHDTGADTGPSSVMEESRIAKWVTTGKKALDPPTVSEQKEESDTLVTPEAVENTKKKVLKPLKLSEENPRSKHSHSSRKHESSKKKRWHRIIVDSGEDTSDTEIVAEPQDTHRGALDQRLDNHREREKSANSEHRTEEGRGVKRRRVVPCLSGVLVEDRQSEKRAKTAKQSSKSGSKRSTKTDLLMSVFAKSRQRNNSSNTATGRPVPTKTPYSSTSLSEPYKSAGTLGNAAGTESESDSGSLATSASAGALALSSDDERRARGTKSQSRKQKRGQQKKAAL